jgi:hypothetical protein
MYGGIKQMNKNQLDLTIKSQTGSTWPNAEFNQHQKVRLVLEEAICHFHLDSSLQYEVILVQGGTQRSLQLEDSLEEAGVLSGDTLLVRTIGRTIDG